MAWLRALRAGKFHWRTHRRDGRLLIDIEDNGMGIAPERLVEVYGAALESATSTSACAFSTATQFKMDIRSQAGRELKSPRNSPR